MVKALMTLALVRLELLREHLEHLERPGLLEHLERLTQHLRHLMAKAQILLVIKDPDHIATIKLSRGKKPNIIIVHYLNEKFVKVSFG